MTSSTNLHVCLISSYFIHFNIKSYSSSTSLLSPCVLMKDHKDHRAAQYIPGDGYGYLLYGGCQVSSIWGRTKPHLRWWSYRKWRHRKWRHVSMFCACPDFSPRFFLLTIVVQATWLPEVTKGLVTPSGFPWVCACVTRSWATSALVGPFDRKWRYETLPLRGFLGWDVRMRDRKCPWGVL
jgi:hypothetical protein